MNKNLARHGVSLIELLLVVSIMAIILASAYPLGSGFLVRNTFKNKVNEVVGSLRVAQLNSISGKEASNWGVYITSSQITLFKGTSFATRDATYDEVYSVPSSVSLAPVPTEIVFDRLSGNPTATATISISSNFGQAASVSVNEVGTVDVN